MQSDKNLNAYLTFASPKKKSTPEKGSNWNR
jgi:hypothetical protein